MNTNDLNFGIFIKLIPLEHLRVSEAFCQQHVDELVMQILDKKAWSHPILVERKSNVILDGHHRFEAAKILKLAKIPCMVIDYTNPKISVSCWNTGIKLDKDQIISQSLQGVLLERKSTRHHLDINIPVLCDFSVSDLMGDTL